MKRVKPDGTLEILINLIDELYEQENVDRHKLNQNINRFSQEFYRDNKDNLKNPHFIKHLTKRMNHYLYERLTEEYSFKR